MDKRHAVLLLLLALAATGGLLLLAGDEPHGPPAAPPTAPPIAPEEPAPEIPPPPEPARDGVARIELEPGFRVSGRVEEIGGEPIADAAVGIFGGSSTRSGADGTFTVFAPEEGEVELFARHPGRLDAKARTTAPAEGVVLVLEPGLSVSGRVSFPDGRPLPGAWVQASGEYARAMTDKEGRYRLTGLPEGEVRLSCHPDGQSRIVAAGTTNIDFTVREHVVRITVVTEEREPVRNVSVRARATRDGEEIMSMAGSTGRDGTIQCEAPPGSVLEVSPSAPGRAEAVTRIELEGSPRLHEEEIVLPRSGEPGRIALRVVRDTGEIPEKAFVRLENEAGAVVGDFYDREVALDREGRAKVEAPPGRHTLSVGTVAKHGTPGDDSGLRTERAIFVEPGRSTAADLVVGTGGRVRVTVRNREGEVVAPGRGLRILGEGGERLPMGFWGITVFDGKEAWTMPPDHPGPAWLGGALPPGNYTVVLVRDGDEIARRDFAVVRGRTAEIELRLPD